MTVSDNPREWTVEQFQVGIANALKAGDMRFVQSALTLMAVAHPREASEVFDTIKVGLALRGAP